METFSVIKPLIEKVSEEWVWKHIVPGGIIACHDYFPHRESCLATKAIDEFLEK